MKTFVLIIAGLLFLSGCQTLRQVDNPLATAYSGFDQDGDGVISEQEAQASPTLEENFDRIDTNRSGGIDDNEYAAATMHVADLSFEEVDVNQDGVISEREAGAMPVSLKEAFGDVDTDGDSNVSPGEYEAATTNLLDGVDFASLDEDGDGVIGSAEAEKMPPLAEAFARVDSDADDLISEEEFRAAQR
jgi:Ca2+-binding EF-hand superfamily protein